MLLTDGFCNFQDNMKNVVCVSLTQLPFTQNQWHLVQGQQILFSFKEKEF